MCEVFLIFTHVSMTGVLHFHHFIFECGCWKWIFFFCTFSTVFSSLLVASSTFVRNSNLNSYVSCCFLFTGIVLLFSPGASPLTTELSLASCVHARIAQIFFRRSGENSLHLKVTCVGSFGRYLNCIVLCTFSIVLHFKLLISGFRMLLHPIHRRGFLVSLRSKLFCKHRSDTDLMMKVVIVWTLRVCVCGTQ